MIMRVATAFACALLGAAGAAAQQPAPPPPAFAAPNLAEKGVRSMAGSCAACHGTSGKPVPNSPVASLAGRPKEELVQLLGAFKKGERTATVMHQIAKGFGDDEIAALADFFSKQPR